MPGFITRIWQRLSGWGRHSANVTEAQQGPSAPSGLDEKKRKSKPKTEYSETKMEDKENVVAVEQYGSKKEAMDQDKQENKSVDNCKEPSEATKTEDGGAGGEHDKNTEDDASELNVLLEEGIDEDTIKTLVDNDYTSLMAIRAITEDDLHELDISLGQRSLLRAAVAKLVEDEEEEGQANEEEQKTTDTKGSGEPVAEQNTEMGNCCACCRGEDDTEETRRLLGEDGGQKKRRGKVPKKGGSGDYAFEQNLIDNTMMKTGKVSKVAIVSFDDGTLRASAPSGFIPEPHGIKDIIEALKGNTGGIASNGIKLGNNVPVSTPGKLDEGKAIYGADGRGGGCTVFKTKECILIVVYNKDPAPATRLASEVAEYMEEQGH